MKFKPVALLVIGLFLGSAMTLMVIKSSSPSNEILACTNKKSGKVRLTVSGQSSSESEDVGTNIS